MIKLLPDCENCAALCCVALAIDKGDAFAFDKPAGTPCQHLAPDHRCAIHADLTARGCRGCVQYSCEGAGQRVVQELFAGQSWLDDPALLPPMLDAFALMRQVHGLLGLLVTAKKLPLPKPQLAELDTYMAPLEIECWTLDTLRGFGRSDLPVAIHRFLRGLMTVLPEETKIII